MFEIKEKAARKIEEIQRINREKSMAKIKAELKKHNHLLQKNEAIQNKTKLENEIISHYKICHKKEN